MDFYIKKGATLPILYVEFVQTGYDNDWQTLFDRIENTVVSFTMTDSNTCLPVVKCSDRAFLMEDTKCKTSGCFPKYYIGFPFLKKHTAKTGDYLGEFEISFLDNGDVLKAPIREKLNIHIID